MSSNAHSDRPRRERQYHHDDDWVEPMNAGTMPGWRSAWLGFVALLLVAPGMVHAQREIASSVVAEGRLGFDGYATPGPWSAWTDSVAGYLTGGASIEEVRGWVEFPAATLDSDNGRRDRDMRKSLETDKYPMIRFDVLGVREEEAFGDSSRVLLQGTFDLHGVRREVALEAMVGFEGSKIRLRTDFPLNLEDYDIGGLSKMLGILKMNKMITVHVDVVFETDPDGDATSHSASASASAPSGSVAIGR